MKRVFTEEQKARKKEYLRDWRAANPEKARAASTRANRKRVKQPGFAQANSARVGQWQRENPDKVADRQQRRLAREAEAGSYTEAEWAAKWEEYDGRCAYCGAPATERDHVMPLCRGGSNCIDNIVPCCRTCNASKGVKTVSEWFELP